MKFAKRTAEYVVLKRADGRYAVKGADGKFINGDDKVNILIAEGLRTAPEPKAEAPAPEEAAEESDAAE